MFLIILLLATTILKNYCHCQEATYPSFEDDACVKTKKIYDNLGININETPVEKAITDPELVTSWSPTTNWCGPGANADNNSNSTLGWAKHVDACCMQHDHCPTIIKKQETRYGFENKTPYTRLHCTCERKFFLCLLRAIKHDKETSEKILNIYFRLHDVYCFDKMIVNAAKGNNNKNCKEHALSKKYKNKCIRFEDDELWNNKRKLTLHGFFSVEQERKTAEYIYEITGVQLPRPEKDNNILTKLRQDASSCQNWSIMNYIANINGCTDPHLASEVINS